MEHSVTATHRVFDRDIPSVLTIDPGDVVNFDCPTSADWGPNATAADLARLDLDHVHILTGPIAIRGAEPGDALTVDILDVTPSKEYGTIFFVPGFGLLPDDFGDEPCLRVIPFIDGRAMLRPDIAVPVEPFLGIMANAPGEPGEHSTIPPRTMGGNLDIRHLRTGTSLVLPVEVSGALFSCGDGHAAQGDGEVCVTAVETSMHTKLRFRLEKGAAPPSPQAIVRREIERPSGGAGYYLTTGIGDDLHRCAQDAIRNMIAVLQRNCGLSRQDSYILCSMAVDLRVSEIVNQPNSVVTAYLPLSVFMGTGDVANAFQRHLGMP